MELSLIKIFSIFFLVFGFGNILFLPTAPIELTGKGFWKLSSSLSFGFVFISLATIYFEIGNSLILVSYLSFLIATSLIYFLSNEMTKKKNFSFYGFSCLSVLSYFFFVQNSSFDLLNLALSIGLGGSVFFAMILGHYYLVVPKLSERPLIILHYFMWIFMGIKLIIFTSQLIGLNLDFSFRYLWDWVFISMRALWGFFALGVLSFFSFKLSRMRSTQSATGVLYVMVFFVFVGEIISIYLNLRGYKGL